MLLKRGKVFGSSHKWNLHVCFLLPVLCYLALWDIWYYTGSDASLFFYSNRHVPWCACKNVVIRAQTHVKRKKMHRSNLPITVVLKGVRTHPEDSDVNKDLGARPRTWPSGPRTWPVMLNPSGGIKYTNVPSNDVIKITLHKDCEMSFYPTFFSLLLNIVNVQCL